MISYSNLWAAILLTFDEYNLGFKFGVSQHVYVSKMNISICSYYPAGNIGRAHIS